jgi:toxin ParE1/3/4
LSCASSFFAASAENDFSDILRYITIESGSREIGFAFIGKLRSRCKRLAALPGMLGTSRSELRPDIRSVVEQGYIIFFRYTGARVEIINVLAGHRDIGAHFGAPDQPQPH